ncbi:hypothetical protein D9619_009744 [Psilocybe cf. subviscida]|uniref:Beta-lactamase-related domain-containing protein n=1 Tax=Psilocybe cf. subviscida TaxID=2480587 RepID=A0A8H5F6X5_9AGAR|nr:hypothetical protein D9619_009744 [Psilocybe cf. subviscida]
MTTFSTRGKEALDDYIETVGIAKTVPGFVLGVANVEGEIYFQNSGFNRFDDPSSGKVNPDSVFWLVSQTRLISHLAALKLIEQGKLCLHSHVADYLPEFRTPVIVDRLSSQKKVLRPAKTAVTVKHLLNFSSGLFYPIEEGQPMRMGINTSKEMHQTTDPSASFFRLIMGELPGMPLKFEPGTDWAYGWSSDVLGFLVEKISGLTLHQFCKQHIFDPLGMESSSFYLTPALRKRLVNLTFRDNGGPHQHWANQMDIIEQDPDKVKVLLGGAGMYSSMKDYLKILQHLLQIKVNYPIENPLFSQETVEQIFTPALTEQGSKSLSGFSMSPGTQWGTALAICTEDLPQRRRKGSVFWSGLLGTKGFIDPTTGIAVVFGTQIMTPQNFDIDLFNTWGRLEELIYAAITSNKPRL